MYGAFGMGLSVLVVVMCSIQFHLYKTTDVIENP